MADVNQLASDITDLRQAVADNQAAITAVQSYAQSQAVEIQNLEQQITVLPLQTGGANLDLSSLEASIKSLRQQNQALLTVVPQQSGTAASAPESAPAPIVATDAPTVAPTDAPATGSTLADVSGVASPAPAAPAEHTAQSSQGLWGQ